MSNAGAAKASGSSKAVHISLWVVQVLLAFAFGMSGFMKVTKPIEELASAMSFVSVYSEGMVRFIGAAELAGALGLILPAALRIVPNLTPVAAGGLTVVMALAVQYHLSHGEADHVAPALVLGVLSLMVAFGRLKLAPISSR